MLPCDPDEGGGSCVVSPKARCQAEVVLLFWACPHCSPLFAAMCEKAGVTYGFAFSGALWASSQCLPGEGEVFTDLSKMRRW